MRTTLAPVALLPADGLQQLPFTAPVTGVPLVLLGQALVGVTLLPPEEV